MGLVLLERVLGNVGEILISQRAAFQPRYMNRSDIMNKR